MSKSLKKLIDINRLREFKNKLVGAGSAYVQTGAVDQTVAGTKTFSKPIAGSVTGSSGSCTGNSATATKATQDAAGNTITTTYATKAENNTKANDSEVVHKSGDETIAGTKTFTGNIIGIDKSGSTEDANSLYSTTAGSKLTYYTVSNGSTTLANVPATVNTTLESRTIRRLSDSDWIVEQICHNSNGLYYRKGSSGTWGAWKTFAFTDSDISGNAATATTATTAEACTGNAATATKLATARTIALSGAATGTATAFDGSGNITIPVTALASSAIRAQWYAAYPDGAEAHNAMWGGRDITAAFDSGEFSRNVADGTFKDVFPGDYITKQITIPQVLADNGTTVLFDGGTYTVNWVVADCDYWINKGDTAAHHVAIVLQAPIFNAQMNTTNTTEGGYAGSEMYKNVIPACATGIVNAFGSSHILTFSDGISNSVDTSHVSSGIPQFTGTPGWWGAWVSVRCNLMSEKMVYGAPICAAGAMDNTMATRQMSAFRLSEKLINYNRQYWWLRDVVSSTSFARVNGNGSAATFDASHSLGVRPFALLV